MRYREIPPSNPVLAPYIRCFWTLSASFQLDPQIIVPDGCPELIFHFGDPYLRLDESGNANRQTQAFVYGQIERAIVIQPSGACSDVVGVRFHPAGLAAFTRVPQHELTGRMVDCRDLWGALPEFRHQAAHRIPAIEQFLAQRLRQPILTWRQDLSSRQNRRRFLDAVGLTPKRFERVRRLQRAMNRLGSSNLADVAAEAGYFDQAHFTRDFREFTGQTPSQFLSQPHAISDFFTQSVRIVQDPIVRTGQNGERL
jgi:AraC-like DNA-binding protein